MHIDVGIVVVGAGHGCNRFTWFVIVGGYGVSPFGIGEWQFCTEVAFTRYEFGKGIAAIIAGKHNIDNGIGKRLYFAYYAWAAFVKNQHNGFAGFGKGFDKGLLIGRERQVVEVAGSFAIRVFAHASHYHIGLASCFHSAVDAEAFLHIPFAVLGVIIESLLEHNIVFAIYEAKGFVDSVVVFVKTSIVGALPSVRPTAVERTHRVGIRPG